MSPTKRNTAVFQSSLIKVHGRSSGNKAQITIVACASATGVVLPPCGEMSTEGIQSREISSNECAVCFGVYDDDLGQDGKPVRDWIQCTYPDCSKWMKDSNHCMICPLCHTLFK